MKNFTNTEVIFFTYRVHKIRKFIFLVDWIEQTAKRWQYIKKMMQAYENYISWVFKLILRTRLLIG